MKESMVTVMSVKLLSAWKLKVEAEHVLFAERFCFLWKSYPPGN